MRHDPKEFIFDLVRFLELDCLVPHLLEEVRIVDRDCRLIDESGEKIHFLCGETVFLFSYKKRERPNILP